MRRAVEADLFELEKTRLEIMERLGLVSNAKHLEEYRKLVEAQHKIDIKAAEDRAELWKNDPVRYREALEAIDALKRKHSLGMMKIDGDMQVESRRIWAEVLDPIAKGFETSMDAMMRRTTTLRDAMRNLGRSIVSEWINLVIKKLVHEWLLGN